MSGGAILTLMELPSKWLLLSLSTDRSNWARHTEGKIPSPPYCDWWVGVKLTSPTEFLLMWSDEECKLVEQFVLKTIKKHHIMTKKYNFNQFIDIIHLRRQKKREELKMNMELQYNKWKKFMFILYITISADIFHRTGGFAQRFQGRFAYRTALCGWSCSDYRNRGITTGKVKKMEERDGIEGLNLKWMTECWYNKREHKVDELNMLQME